MLLDFTRKLLSYAHPDVPWRLLCMTLEQGPCSQLADARWNSSPRL